MGIRAEIVMMKSWFTVRTRLRALPFRISGM
jgi:hypothetical protein